MDNKDVTGNSGFEDQREIKKKAGALMNTCTAHEGLSKKIDEIAMNLYNISNIEVKNGTVKVIKIEELLKDLWEATMFARDRRKVYKIFLKYPVLHKTLRFIFYRLIPIAATFIVLMHFYKFQVMEVVKHFLKLN